MVKFTTRLNKLRPLLDVRIGPGARILSPPPAPQLVRIDLKYPRDKKRRPGPVTDGAFQFHKKYLPRLKYHNPQLAINVETPPQAEMLLTLHFEGTDPEALRAIAKKSENPRSHLQKRKDANEQAEAVETSGNWRDAPARPGTEIKIEPTPRDTTNDIKRPNADNDEVRIKAQPAVNPSSPSTVSPPVTIYERSVTLHMNDRPHWDIWKWFKNRAGGQTVVQSAEDRLMKSRLGSKAKASEVAATPETNSSQKMRQDSRDGHPAEVAAATATGEGQAQTPAAGIGEVVSANAEVVKGESTPLAT